MQRIAVVIPARDESDRIDAALHSVAAAARLSPARRYSCRRSGLMQRQYG